MASLKRYRARTPTRLKTWPNSAGEGFSRLLDREVDGGEVLINSLQVNLGDIARRAEVDQFGIMTLKRVEAPDWKSDCRIREEPPSSREVVSSVSPYLIYVLVGVG